MTDTHLNFDELLTMKALMFKANISGRGTGSLMGRIVERDPDQAEAIGMKNICFRAHPDLQARFEVNLEALGMSKQEALTEALEELLRRWEAKLEQVGVGLLDHSDRLRALGFEWRPHPEHGHILSRIDNAPKEG